MAAEAAAEAPVAQKREREDVQLQELGQNQQKRRRHSLLSEFLFEEDVDSLETVQDETVLYVMKSLEEEISATREIPTEKVDVGGIEASDARYEYLVNATDDELGIPPSTPEPLQGKDGQHVSENLWNDVFEDSSDQKVNLLLQPFLTYCYSINYRDFEVYSAAIPDSEGQKWFEDEDSMDSVLNECIAHF